MRGEWKETRVVYYIRSCVATLESGGNSDRRRCGFVGAQCTRSRRNRSEREIERERAVMWCVGESA